MLDAPAARPLPGHVLADVAAGFATAVPLWSGAAAACGMRAIVLWQVSVDRDVVAFRDVPHLRSGDIILMHFRPSLADELRLIRDRAAEAGLRFALLEDYLVPDAVPPR